MNEQFMTLAVAASVVAFGALSSGAAVNTATESDILPEMRAVEATKPVNAMTAANLAEDVLYAQALEILSQKDMQVLANFLTKANNAELIKRVFAAMAQRPGDTDKNYWEIKEVTKRLGSDYGLIYSLIQSLRATSSDSRLADSVIWGLGGKVNNEVYNWYDGIGDFNKLVSFLEAQNDPEFAALVMTALNIREVTRTFRSWMSESGLDGLATFVGLSIKDEEYAGKILNAVGRASPIKDVAYWLAITNRGGNGSEDNIARIVSQLDYSLAKGVYSEVINDQKFVHGPHTRFVEAGVIDGIGRKIRSDLPSADNQFYPELGKLLVSFNDPQLAALAIIGLSFTVNTSPLSYPGSQIFQWPGTLPGSLNDLMPPLEVGDYGATSHPKVPLLEANARKANTILYKAMFSSINSMANNPYFMKTLAEMGKLL